MRVRLASWFRGSAPGSVVDVADAEAPGLMRDGRIAEVLGDEQPVLASSEPPAEQVVSIDGGDGEPQPKPRRRSKSDE